MSHEDAQPDLDTGSDEQQNGASRKGQPWTEEEHLAFLEGLRKLGKGSWRAISSTFVPSRTPTQVASHAQKHFMRLHGATKRKSRFTALEQEAHAGGKGDTRGDHDHHRVDDDARPDQPTAQPGGQAQQPAQAFPPMGAFPGAMSFPFMHPMMFGFPGGFFPPFMCPPPAFAAAPMGAMPKGGQMPPVMMPPMFPMAAMAMAPYFAMAQQMAVAAAAQAAAVAQQNQQQQGQYAAVSAGATTAGTTSDTANSDEVAPRVRSTPGSPGGPCKPDARRPSVTGGAALARPGEASSSPSVPPASCQGGSGGKRAAPAGNAGVAAEESPAKLPRRSSTGHGGDEATVPFHASSHSAFRPPQEIKAES